MTKCDLVGTDLHGLAVADYYLTVTSQRHSLDIATPLRQSCVLIHIADSYSRWRWI